MRLGEWDWIAAEFSTLLDDEVDPLDRMTALAGLITLLAYRGEPTSDLVARLEAVAVSDDDTVKGTAIANVMASEAFASAEYALARSRTLAYGQLLTQTHVEVHLRAAHCGVLARDACGRTRGPRLGRSHRSARPGDRR